MGSHPKWPYFRLVKYYSLPCVLSTSLRAWLSLWSATCLNFWNKFTNSFGTNVFPHGDGHERSVHPDLNCQGSQRALDNECQMAESHKECQKECQNMGLIEYQLLGIIWGSILFLYFPRVSMGLWGFHIYVCSFPLGSPPRIRKSWGLIAWCRKGLLCVLHRQSSKACGRQEVMETYGRDTDRKSIYFSII